MHLRISAALQKERIRTSALGVAKRTSWEPILPIPVFSPRRKINEMETSTPSFLPAQAPKRRSQVGSRPVSGTGGRMERSPKVLSEYQCLLGTVNRELSSVSPTLISQTILESQLCEILFAARFRNFAKRGFAIFLNFYFDQNPSFQRIRLTG